MFLFLFNVNRPDAWLFSHVDSLDPSENCTVLCLWFKYVFPSLFATDKACAVCGMTFADVHAAWLHQLMKHCYRAGNICFKCTLWSIYTPVYHS